MPPGVVIPILRVFAPWGPLLLLECSETGLPPETGAPYQSRDTSRICGGVTSPHAQALADETGGLPFSDGVPGEICVITCVITLPSLPVSRCLAQGHDRTTKGQEHGQVPREAALRANRISAFVFHQVLADRCHPRVRIRLHCRPRHATGDADDSDQHKVNREFESSARRPFSVQASVAAAAHLPSSVR